MTQSVFSQNKQVITDHVYVPSPDLEVAPGVTVHPNHHPRPLAMWDIEFSYNIEQLTSQGSWVGACWVNGEWWSSQWNTDTLARFDANGALIGTFVVPGVSGVRSLTTDGTNVYAGAASTTVYIIDPVTRTSTGNITTPVPARHCSYDPTGNGGAGSLWVGNWDTDIVQVSLAGATISSIAAANHGLTGMYGSAYDGVSAGGPYLWVYDQSGPFSSAEIVQLQLPAGTPTGLTWNTMRDVGATSSDGLSGGLNVANVNGKWIMAGVLQGTPDNILFGYELDTLGPVVDGALNATLADNGYTRIPQTQVGSIAFTGEVFNNGSAAITALNYNVEVLNGGSSVFTDQQVASNLASYSGATLTSATFTPSGLGTYDVSSYTSVTAPQVDSIPANDSISYSFEITDSVYARDDGIHDGGQGYAASATDWAYVAMLFDVNNTDTLTSITIEIETPIQDDTTYAVVAEANGGVPGVVLLEGPPVIIQQFQNVYTLPIPGGLQLTPGQYAIGCYEGAGTTINLRQSNNIFTQDMNFFFLPNQGWFFSSIPTARFIRPNFGIVGAVGIEEEQFTSGTVKVYPNPNEGAFFVEVALDQPEAFEVRVTDLVGQTVYTREVQFQQQDRMQIDLQGEAPGVYFVTLTNGQEAVTKKVILN